MEKLKISLIMILLTMFSNAYSQDFAYKPINPAFGGDTFNHQWLMASAQAQNDHKNDLSRSMYDEDPMEEFQENLNRLVLNQLSRNIIDTQFGEDGIQEGTYQLGNYEIIVGAGSDGMNVGITDLTTGNQTNVLVPHF
ncbi:MAG: curli assembly protein CsgF [Ichthyobacteriaceae bacterium]|nr:curli assembly protein CsgF [Ichthyobacteriaceae bacterium]